MYIYIYIFYINIYELKYNYIFICKINTQIMEFSNKVILQSYIYL